MVDVMMFFLGAEVLIISFRCKSMVSSVHGHVADAVLSLYFGALLLCQRLPALKLSQQHVASMFLQIYTLYNIIQKERERL